MQYIAGPMPAQPSEMTYLNCTIHSLTPNWKMVAERLKAQMSY